MVAACNLENSIEVRTFGDVGKDNLQTYLEIFTQKPAFKQHVKRLGIIRDAEKKAAASALQSVQAALQGARIAPPSQMNKLEGSPLSIGIYILPNCRDVGMLEDLCLAAASEVEQGLPSSVFECVDDFFACLKRQGRVPSNPAKARFAGFALAGDVIDPQLGRAAQRNAIPWQAHEFDQLKAFLHLIANR